MSGKGRLLGWLGGWVLTEAKVREVDAPHPQYRRIVLEGDGLRADAWRPGDKVQVLLPSEDVRTYTPIDWEGGRTTLLAYLHGAASPGASWASTVAVGDAVRFLGPQRSLRLDGVDRLVGDETSLAIAATARRLGARASLRVGDVEAAEAALRSLGVTAEVGGDELLATFGGTRVAAVCGGSAWVQAARAALREVGAEVRVKAYWVPGRTGID